MSVDRLRHRDLLSSSPFTSLCVSLIQDIPGDILVSRWTYTRLLPRVGSYVGRLVTRLSVLASSLLVPAYWFPSYTREHTRTLVTCTSKLASSVLVYSLPRQSYVHARCSPRILLVLLTVAMMPRHSQTAIYSGHSALCNSFMSIDSLFDSPSIPKLP
jgi:hypothetical protein